MGNVPGPSELKIKPPTRAQASYNQQQIINFSSQGYHTWLKNWKNDLFCIHGHNFELVNDTDEIRTLSETFNSPDMKNIAHFSVCSGID